MEGCGGGREGGRPEGENERGERERERDIEFQTLFIVSETMYRNNSQLVNCKSSITSGSDVANVGGRAIDNIGRED